MSHCFLPASQAAAEDLFRQAVYLRLAIKRKFMARLDYTWIMYTLVESVFPCFSYILLVELWPNMDEE